MSQNKIFRIFIDTGGTFTDCIGYTPEGKILFKKVLSTGTLRAEISSWMDDRNFIINDRWDLSKDIISGYHVKFKETGKEFKVTSFEPTSHTITITPGLPANLKGKKLAFELTAFEDAPVLGTRLITQTALDEKFPPLEIRLGSTRGTNALLENKGAKTALLTTRGFRDLLFIGDQSRPDIFAAKIEKPFPLVSKVLEINERTAEDGKIITPIEIPAIGNLLQELKKEGFESIAVALLNSYRNPEHEQKLKKIILDNGVHFISLSSELSSLIKLLERTETAVVNAYLAPVIHNYLENISNRLQTGSIRVMTSAGGLVGARSFYPKDSLLSGPAGGVVGASLTGKRSGYHKIISFDMGGTSTDVSRYDQFFDYRYELKVGQAKIMTSALSIETVAAGGGSICGFDGFKLFVGPESAGANPGPACYGAGGPFTLTDVNLLLGKLSEKNFSIPVNTDDAQDSLRNLLDEIRKATGNDPDPYAILKGFISIANETMAGAVKKISLAKGYDPSDHALVSFGGAGGLHACGIAENLGIRDIIIPSEAGLLSARGIASARLERFATKQFLQALETGINNLEEEFDLLSEQAYKELARENIRRANSEIRQKLIYLRFIGQDSSIEIEFENEAELRHQFRKKYEKLYGHWVENREIEIEAIRVVASEKIREERIYSQKISNYNPEPDFITSTKIPVYMTQGLIPGCKTQGPSLLLDEFSTFYLEEGWTYEMDQYHTGIVKQVKKDNTRSEAKPEAAELELFTHRFMSVAENMGAMLRRTALSVNIKERLDFSCALLDADGYLVANAPHIPVHLGGLGICVRELLKSIEFKPGDTVVTNHPAYGGSHLPDVTTITPVFNRMNNPVAYIVNRAHHSEIGGLSPGSMPPAAKNLAEEGVVISPFFLVRDGKANWEEMKITLSEAPYPTRAVEENLADLNASLAANIRGVEEVKKLIDFHGEEKVKYFFKVLREYAARRMRERLTTIPEGAYSAVEFLDDGSPIKVKIIHSDQQTIIDFTGSAEVSHNNMNATRAIVHSVVIYVMRLLLDEPIPLNDGLLDTVKIILPKGMLDPPFPDDITKCPAVVGGNVEISMRLTDTLLKAFGTMAASQGTMNNVLFGNNRFGYYETLAGGTGAGKGFHGTSATHHHMTNTRITDPEIMEQRYPVKLIRFEIRKNSGGKGKWKGGDGLIREYEFQEPVNLSILSQRRKTAPYGMNGGAEGTAGNQYVIKKNGKRIDLKGIDNIDLTAGDRFIVETPGGGGWGFR